MPRILLVEDDKRLSSALCEILRNNGYTVDALDNGREGLEYGSSELYDVIILDVMLPGLDGFQIVAELRRQHISTPILILTAKDSIPEKIKGYDNGADDYMTKPFSPAELLAHLRALTRRKGEVIFETLTFADLSLNLESNDLTCNDNTLHLRMKEFLILEILMGNAGHIISKETLLDRVWGVDSITDANNVEAHISFLRKKLRFLNSCAQIETVPKLGYRLSEAACPDASESSNASK